MRIRAFLFLKIIFIWFITVETVGARIARPYSISHDKHRQRGFKPAFEESVSAQNIKIVY